MKAIDKNLLLDKGCDNSVDKICGSSKAMMEGDKLAWKFLEIFYKMVRYLSNLPTAGDITRHLQMEVSINNNYY